MQCNYSLDDGSSRLCAAGSRLSISEQDFPNGIAASSRLALGPRLVVSKAPMHLVGPQSARTRHFTVTLQPKMNQDMLRRNHTAERVISCPTAVDHRRPYPYTLCPHKPYLIGRGSEETFPEISAVLAEAAGLPAPLRVLRDHPWLYSECICLAVRGVVPCRGPTSYAHGLSGHQPRC